MKRENVLTAPEAAQRRKEAQQDLAGWRQRRADVANRMTVVRARSEGLAKQIANAVLVENGEDKAFSAMRRERQLLVLEVEELALALKGADERITAAEADDQRAERRLAVTSALAQLDRLGALAGRVDEAWAPLHRLLAELILAHQDTAPMLDRLIPGTRHERGRDALARVLLRPLSDLIEVPRAIDQSERGALRGFFEYAASRAQLEQELAEGGDGR